MLARSVIVGVAAALAACLAAAPVMSDPAPDVSVGPQYDGTHVYVAPADLNAFIASFTATFGGTASKPLVTNVLPVPSSATFRYVMTPVGSLSVFAFTTPVPFPFGAERTGYLVTDLDAGVAAARASGAEVVVEPFRDPIGRDAVVRWPGGFQTQLYWHFVKPVYPPLATTPDNRVYVSADQADEFLRDFLSFSHGRVASDEANADAGEIGRPSETYRRVRIESGFGKMQVMITDGHLPHPFGRELAGYEVGDLPGTVARAVAAGATVLSPPYDAGDRTTAVLQFPGGYIAEAHALKAR